MSGEGAFLASFQGDSEQLRRPAIVRAFGAMERQERHEAAEAEQRAEARRAQAEGQALGNMMRRRQELYAWGSTSEELAAAGAEREERRQAEIQQHREALQRLGALPRDPVTQRSGQVEADRLLARAKAVDTPFMRDQIRRYHERGAYGREITRTCDASGMGQASTLLSGEIVRMSGY